ncbi:hypothetical protein CABS03_03168 [Colletotrichum abscissum]
MKKRKKQACQTSIDTHPDRAPKGKTTIRDEIITALYTATFTGGRPPCGGCESNQSSSL